MKKLLTLAFAIVALAVFTGLSVGQGAQQKDKQKSPPPKSVETKPAPTTPPAPMAKNSAHATEQVMTGTVTKVNDKAQTFAVTANGKEVNFSGKNLKAPFPKVGDFVDVTYTHPQNPSEPPSATTVKGSKSNGSERVTADHYQSEKVVNGTVTEVNEKTRTFVLKTDNGEQFTFSFSAKEMPPPKKGDQVAVTYDQPTPGGPLEARAVKGSKSNSSDRVADDKASPVTQGDDNRIFCGDHTDTPRCCGRNGGYWVQIGDVGGCNFYYYYYRVTKVNDKDKTFAVTANGKELNFSAKNLKAPLPKVGDFVDITYTQNPGEPPMATTVKGSKSNSSDRIMRPDFGAKPPAGQVVTGTVTEVNDKAQTFTIKTANGEQFTFSAKKAAPLPKKGEQVDVTYIQQTPGGQMEATTVNTSKSNTFRVADGVHSAQQITGKVLRVNKEANTFTIMAKGKEVTFSTEKLKGPPPEVGKIYDITYTPNPGGANWSINLNSSRSNIY